MTTSTEKAASLYKEGHFHEAFSEYCKSAEDGDVLAKV
jgi:hypothetical protein